MSETAREIEFSFVAPVYNEADGLEHFYQRLKAVAESLEHATRSSSSTTARPMAPARSSAAWPTRIGAVRYVDFSRNFGHQAALTAGYDYASGRAVISLDSDCQHPPELIPRAGGEMARRAPRSSTPSAPTPTA